MTDAFNMDFPSDDSSLPEKVDTLKNTAIFFLQMYGVEHTFPNGITGDMVEWETSTVRSNYRIVNWNEVIEDDMYNITQISVSSEYPDGQKSVVHYSLNNRTPGFVKIIEVMTLEQAEALETKFANIDNEEIQAISDLNTDPELEIDMLIDIVASGLESKSFPA